MKWTLTPIRTFLLVFQKIEMIFFILTISQTRTIMSETNYRVESGYMEGKYDCGKSWEEEYPTKTEAIVEYNRLCAGDRYDYVDLVECSLNADGDVESSDTIAYHFKKNPSWKKRVKKKKHKLVLVEDEKCETCGKNIDADYEGIIGQNECDVCYRRWCWDCENVELNFPTIDSDGEGDNVPCRHCN